MKASGFFVFSWAVLSAILALAGCDNAGQSQFAASSQARSRTSPANMRLPAAGSGKQKVGQFWWVWNTVTISPRTTDVVDADCPAGFIPTSGGYNYSLTGSQQYYLFILGSQPLDAGTIFGWAVTGFNDFGTSIALEAWAICAKER